MTRTLTEEEQAEVTRRLIGGAAAYRVSQDLKLPITTVRRIRDELRVPPLAPGRSQLAKPEPVRWDDTDDVDGDSLEAHPHRIPVGQWCVERPNQAQWLALVDAANGVELVALRLAMCWVLDLPLGASDERIGQALTEERRTAEDLAGLYIKARGYGR